ncbi:sigma-70 family RNA polymerase sigma factor [Bengtsoniella intestinalis]|uniref:RNA polymerase sigma factor n=1 Tax=Bengtsoniella intestinalis TaxID=3073143 RepID=UPI00391F8554
MTDDEIYKQFLSGDESAFAGLMERFGDALTLYIYGYTHDFGDAEDLMIEVFSYLVVKKPKIKTGALKAYLYKSARHMALRSVAKSRRYFAIELEQLEELSDEKALVDALVDTKERHRILHLSMAELSPNYREAIYLVYFEGMSHKETAAVMGKGEKQVADLIHRGKKSLKTKLEQEGITHA